MLRTPMISEAEEVVKICDISMNTQIETIEKISKVCRSENKKHNIIIMVEVDDKREGLLPGEVISFCRAVDEKYKSVNILGLGTNARCVSTKRPTFDSIKVLIDLRKKIKDSMGINLPIISGGNSSIWNLIEKGDIPSGINQVRIGEAILLGHETVDYKPIKGAFLDSFILESEIIEAKKKEGGIYKVILALGIQDVGSKNLFCSSPDLHIIGQSSDHTVLGIKKGKEQIYKNDFFNLEVGGIISFKLDYFGLLSCMTSRLPHFLS